MNHSLGWVNDAPHSHRNPQGGWPSNELGQKFHDEGFARFASFWKRCVGD
jgi:hypothetical protein